MANVAPLTSYGDDPFPEERLKNFNSKEIIEDLKCGICTLIGVDAVECSQCQQIYCSVCVNQIKATAKAKGKQEPNCPLGCSPWKLNKLHKMYRNSLERLNFSCSDENCIATFSIDTYKDHKHVYLKENEVLYGYSMKSTQGIVQYLDTYLGKFIEARSQSKDQKDKEFEAIVGKDKYCFNLNTMKVFQSVTKEEYGLMKRKFDNPKVQDKYRWIWYDNDAQTWQPYTLVDSSKIEQEFLAYFINPAGKKTNFILQMHGNQYSINFQYFSQERVDSGFRRSIFRTPAVNKMRFLAGQ